MRIAVLSDVHSNLEALRSVEREIERSREGERREPDLTVFLGDYVGYGSDPEEVVRRVRGWGGRTAYLLGNHDWGASVGSVEEFHSLARKALEYSKRSLSPLSKEWMGSLSPQASLPLPLSEEGRGPPVRLFAFHGSPRDPLWEYVYPEDPLLGVEGPLGPIYKEWGKVPRGEGGEITIVLMGHTHVPFAREFEISLGGEGWSIVSSSPSAFPHPPKDPSRVRLLVLNPGSVGQPRDRDPRASFAWIELEGERLSWSIQRIEYDVEEARRKILRAGLPPFLGDRLLFGV